MGISDSPEPSRLRFAVWLETVPCSGLRGICSSSGNVDEG